MKFLKFWAFSLRILVERMAVVARVGRLRAHGNQINPWNAKEFIEAYQFARSVGLCEKPTKGETDNGAH